VKTWRVCRALRLIGPRLGAILVGTGSRAMTQGQVARPRNISTARLARIPVRFLSEIVPLGAHSCQFLSRSLKNQLHNNRAFTYLRSDYDTRSIRFQLPPPPPTPARSELPRRRPQGEGAPFTGGRRTIVCSVLPLSGGCFPMPDEGGLQQSAPDLAAHCASEDAAVLHRTTTLRSQYARHDDPDAMPAGFGRGMRAGATSLRDAARSTLLRVGVQMATRLT
jgi:hypothetical protein